MENVLKTISYQQLADGYKMHPNNDNKEFNEKMEQAAQNLPDKVKEGIEYLMQQPALYMPTNHE